MKYSIEKLNEGLKNLKGIDYEAAEKSERAAGNMTPLMNFSTAFQVRLAAKALGTNPHEIKSLPINEYTLIANATSNFLFSGGGENEEETQSEKLDKPQ
jgi:hypothetical protein